MTLNEFRAKYRLQQRLTQRGVASYHAVDSSGRVVMVHSLDSASREEVDQVRGMIHRLTAANPYPGTIPRVPASSRRSVGGAVPWDLGGDNGSAAVGPANARRARGANRKAHQRRALTQSSSAEAHTPTARKADDSLERKRR